VLGAAAVEELAADGDEEPAVERSGAGGPAGS